jgi:putative Holliday junction resolvase
MSNTAMGFDFGTKRIGIATGQDLTGTAQGIATVGNSGKNGPWNEIEELIHQWQPDMLVVGLPLDNEGAETNLSTAAREFGTELASRFARPVYYIDETLTSRVAERLVAEATPAGKRMIGRQQGLRDQIAAELILNTFFNEQSQKSNVV